jgi:4-diphosphocytidyl-2-C-methyl-D-erythritol kinase
MGTQTPQHPNARRRNQLENQPLMPNDFWCDDVVAWPAPAKLNLFLHVVGRRADGYHLLQTAFQLLDFGDSVYLDVRNDGQIARRSELVGVDPEQDLVVRAARMLQRESGTQQGVDIRVVKRIPMGGGLGGGSSNAATTLVALNYLWHLGMNVDDLAQLGARLGADVPVFVRGESAWAEGVGERLQPLALADQWFVVLLPSCAIATATIFGAPELTRHTSPLTMAEFLAGASVHNDCESVARMRYPEVDQAMRWLESFAPARMTGTGSSVFATLSSEARAREIAAQVPAPWKVFVARGCNSSALSARIRAHRTR